MQTFCKKSNVLMLWTTRAIKAESFWKVVGTACAWIHSHQFGLAHGTSRANRMLLNITHACTLFTHTLARTPICHRIFMQLT